MGLIPAETLRCPVCADGLADRPVWRCQTCDTPVHRECGEYVGGCARFACPEAASLRRRLVRYVDTRVVHSMAQASGIAIVCGAWMIKTLTVDLFAFGAPALFVLLMILQAVLIVQAVSGLARDARLRRRLQEGRMDMGELADQIRVRGLLPRDSSAARSLAWLAIGLVGVGALAALKSIALVMAGSAIMGTTVGLVGLAALVEAWALQRSAMAVSEGTRLAVLWQDELTQVSAAESGELIEVSKAPDKIAPESKDVENPGLTEKPPEHT